VASPFVELDAQVNEWLTIDLRNHYDDELDFVIVVPGFGQKHRAGLDCWCEPLEDDGVIVHNGSH